MRPLVWTRADEPGPETHYGCVSGRRVATYRLRRNADGTWTAAGNYGPLGTFRTLADGVRALERQRVRRDSWLTWALRKAGI